jgi:hypothetical protein
LKLREKKFKRWLEDLIEFLFNKTIQRAFENKEVHKLTQGYIKFWTFEIFYMRNYVKSIYLMKLHYGVIMADRDSNLFFEIAESTIFKLIENLIKEKDKSLEYSNKK